MSNRDDDTPFEPWFPPEVKPQVPPTPPWATQGFNFSAFAIVILGVVFVVAFGVRIILWLFGV
jgi:hypothetical protein